MVNEITVEKESQLVHDSTVDEDASPGGLSFEEDAAGGLSQHLGVISCTLLIIGRIIRTDIFSMPSSILSSHSVGYSYGSNWAPCFPEVEEKRLLQAISLLQQGKRYQNGLSMELHLEEEILESGVTTADLFFGNVFGTAAEWALSVFVALRLSSLLSVLWNDKQCTNSHMSKTFSAAHVNQELAKEGIPLPFGNKFWASNWPTGESPMPGLIAHLISLAPLLLILPQGSILAMLDKAPSSMAFQGSAVLQLFWWPVAVLYLAVAIFLLVTPLLPPTNGVGDTPPLPY
ncbi:hypothetical protein SCLCIDRAFT_1147362 [Scleroderma citrinum Foug A]|uniref:Uncharacterized protein n=1 Tax=Scleroderma citrinum Foug A TaxID=1036808 RepID=A0A0C2Z2Q6_9AGAM|nr:hypothetical protein SCLCIDRAFT_1147362 [Scleroderma citrinum Foug A]